jgi:hypothetical protein
MIYFIIKTINNITKLPVMNYTSRNNPIRPIFKLPKGGRKMVECLTIIIKKIGKFGIAEFVQLACHLSKIRH